MKANIKKIHNWVRRIVTAVILFFFLTMCIYIDTIEYEATVNANETTTFVVHCRVEPIATSDDTRLVIGFLTPKSWHAAETTTMTYVDNFDEGVQTMSPIPADDTPVNGNGLTWPAYIKSKEGVGPNVLDDMEWIFYWSDKPYSVLNGDMFTVDVTVTTVVGPDNLKAKIGFFANHTNDGFSTDNRHWQFLYTDCFEVINGEGDVLDFCERHFNAIDPLQNTSNDIVTIKFQGDLKPNDLDEAAEVYFCSTAYTDLGNTVNVCDPTDANKMMKDNEFGHNYSITFWPVGYYDLQDGEEILKIEYTFKNEDGSAEITGFDADSTAIPFRYTFRCK